MVVPWREAWHEALYGSYGFYRRAEGPVGHFTTATHGPLGALLAESLARLADREGATHVVDVGCGRGELLAHLHAVRPGQRLTGVDVVDRPASLPDAVGWIRSPGGGDLPDALDDLTDVLVVAHEWLDVVPCTVAEVDASGVLREVLVHPTTGDESPGGPLTDADARWARDHWPDAAPGDRVEVGRSRDRAWADLVARVTSGTLVAVDYGHTATERPHEGTLTAYARGGLTHPVPDGSCDLTAHVAMDTLDADELYRQRDLLRSLGLTGARPDHALAGTDPLGYLRALERAGAEAELARRGGFGDFWWALKRVNGPVVP